MGFDSSNKEFLSLQSRMRRNRAPQMSDAIRPLANLATMLLGIALVGLSGLLII